MKTDKQKRDEDASRRMDPNPILALDTIDNGNGTKRVAHWMAFDPQYGPESERQIEWHRQHGTPGADTWEVGIPCPVSGGVYRSTGKPRAPEKARDLDFNAGLLRMEAA